jgi:hypothetical protein
LIICPKCTRPLPDWLLRDSYINSICPHCQAALELYAFPALYRKAEAVDLTQTALGEGDACCYEHSTKKAAALCANCGRFVCVLCEVQLGSETVCPDCVDGRKVKSQELALETQRTLYDSIALWLATWPLLTIYFTVVTAPLAIGMAIYAWNRPTSIVRRGRWRLFAAIGISTVEIAAIAALIVLIAFEARRRL